MNCLRLFIAAIALCCYSSLHARQYTTSDQLISNTVYAAYRDFRGYMWFGTDKGAVRFDGRSFKNYTLLDGLGDNNIFNFYEDRQRRLWLYSFNGVNCFIRNDSVFNAGNDPLLKRMPVIPNQAVMTETNDTTLYIGYYSGVVLRLRGLNVDTVHSPSPGLFGLSVLYFSGDTLKMVAKEEIRSVVDKRIVKRETFYSGIGRLHKGSLYAPDIKGLKVYRNMKLMAEYDDKRLNWDNILHTYVNEEGDILCGTYDGLLIIDHDTQKPEAVLKNLKVTCVQQDLSGNYWVTTIGNGIYRLNAAFTDMRPMSEANQAKIFFNGNQQVFFTRNDEVFVYTPASGTERLPLRLRGGFEPLYYNPGVLLYRYYSFRSELMDIKSGAVKKICHSSAFLKNVHECDSDRLLLTIHGTGRDRYLLYNALLEDNDYRVCHTVCFRKRITAAQYNPVNRCCYVLTRTALYEYNVDNYRMRRLDTFTGTDPLDLFLIGNRLIVPANDRSQMVYTFGDRPARKRIFTDVVIYASYRLKQGRYLVKTNKGYLLSAPAAREETLPAFKVLEYPFRSTEIVDIYPLGDSLLCNADDQLFLFDQDLLNRKMDRPDVFIEQVTINGRTYPANNIVIRNQSTCNAELTLGTLRFSNAESHYQYRVLHKGDTTPWYRSNAGKINLLLSEYDAYHLYVRSVSENGSASATKMITFQMLPPFYHSWWFRLCELLAGIGVVAGIVYGYGRRRKARYEQELNYMQLEYRSVNSLLNPHFIFNAINNIQGLIGDQQGEKANEYLHLLSRLIRQNIENLRFTLIPLKKELELIDHYVYLQNLRFNNGISLLVHNNLPPQDSCQIPPLLIHTFIENAIVHGYDSDVGSLTIALELDLSTDDYLIIKVTDNGVGCDHHKATTPLTDKTSLGIDSINQRLQRLSSFYKLHYSINIADLADRGGKGTEVLLTLYARLAERVG